MRTFYAAEGEATLTRGQRIEKFQAPVREAVRTGPDGIPAAFVRMYCHFILSSYLKVVVNASLEGLEHEVLTHPVFLLPVFENTQL